MPAFAGMTSSGNSTLSGADPAQFPDDARFLALAFALGRRGLGRTWPNPSVGAVIVRESSIVGRGATQPPGGAHAEMRCEAGYSTYRLGTLVRDQQMLPLEEAIRRLTSVPAQVFGIPLRGTVATGMIADLVVFDQTTISCGKQEAVRDFPGGGLRYIEKSTGIAHTIVNGKILFSNGAAQDMLPGSVIRSNAAH